MFHVGHPHRVSGTVALDGEALGDIGRSADGDVAERALNERAPLGRRNAINRRRHSARHNAAVGLLKVDGRRRGRIDAQRRLDRAGNDFWHRKRFRRSLAARQDRECEDRVRVRRKVEESSAGEVRVYQAMVRVLAHDFGPIEAHRALHGAHLADRAGGENCLQLARKRQAPRPGRFHEEQVLLTGEVDKNLSLLAVDDQRFLAQDVLAGRQRGVDVGVVMRVRRSDVDTVDRLFSKLPSVESGRCASGDLERREAAAKKVSTRACGRSQEAGLAHLVPVKLFVRSIELDLVLSSGDAGLFPCFLDEPFRRIRRPRTDSDDLVLDVGRVTRAWIGKEIEYEFVGDPAGTQDTPAASERGGHGSVCGVQVVDLEWEVERCSCRLGTGF